MATVQQPLIHWFPSVGFRPAVIKYRKDFAGHSGTYPYVFIADDANDPYGSKYDGPYEEPKKELLAYYTPLEKTVIVKEEPSIPPPFIWTDPPIIICCRVIDPPPVDPPPAPVAVADSGIFMLSVVAAFMFKKVLA